MSSVARKYLYRRAHLGPKCYELHRPRYQLIRLSQPAAVVDVGASMCRRIQAGCPLR